MLLTNKVEFLVVLATVLASVHSEPPTTSYGTPLSPPLNSYGTPNYNINNNGGGGGGGGDHHGNNGDHGDHGEPKSYEFGYQVKDDYSGNNYNRKESSDGNQVRGEYRVQLPDGRTQIVTYYADWQTGFHADVRYEGEAQYPDQYNTYQGGYNNNNNNNNNHNNNGVSSQYGAPGFGNGGAGYNNNGAGFNNNYNNNNNNNGGYDSYNNGNFGGKRPGYEYGAP